MAAVRIQQKVQQREQHVQREPKKKKKAQRGIRWTFGEKWCLFRFSHLRYIVASRLSLTSSRFIMSIKKCNSCKRTFKSNKTKPRFIRTSARVKHV